MKKFIAFVPVLISILVFTISCNHNQDKNLVSKPNFLTYQNVLIRYIVPYDTGGVFQNKIDTALFNKVLFENIEKDKMFFYDAFAIEDSLVKYKKYALLKNLGQSIDTTYVENPKTGEKVTKIVKSTINRKEFIGLVFSEHWFFDTTSIKLYKKIRNISLVRQFKNTDDTVFNKTLPFALNNEKDVDGSVKIAENVKYTVPMINGETYPIELVEGLDKIKFTKFLVNIALKKKKKSIDILTKGSPEISIDLLKSNLGIGFDTLEMVNPATGIEEMTITSRNIIYSEFTGIVFIEDWFLNKETSIITKKVKGIGLVREYSNQGTQARSIPFVLMLE